MKKRVIIISTVALLLLTIGLTFAYFSGIISGKGEEIVITAKKVKIIFTDNAEFTSREITPGWRESKTFTIENESDSTFVYNLIFKDLQNTFVTEGFLKYKITSTNGGYNMTEFADIPKQESPTTTILANNLTIDGGVKQKYTVEFVYEDSKTVNQGADMGKVLSGTIFIEGSADTLKEGTLATKILRDNNYRNAVERTDFSAIEESSKLWKAEVTENNTTGTTYYFTGNPNNWVSFAGYLWRVIRINEDGSVRLLYAGSGGEDGIIGTSVYSSEYNHPGYVGFKYTLGSDLQGIRGTKESTILTQLNTWYDTNLVKKDDGENSYDSYISREAVYCNDRELAPGSSFTTGSSEFSFAANGRLYTNKTPTYNCKNEGDRFAGSNLTYPVGLMTADEVSFAGGLFVNENASAYYYLNKTGGSATGSTWWWTMSPFSWWSGGSTHVFNVYGSDQPGRLSENLVTNVRGVRPVVSLKGCTLTSGGTGTGDDPYTVSIDGSCALEEMTTLADKVKSDNNYTAATERTSFSAIETSSKLWKAEVTENNTTGTTYYFTGNPNNWVSFAGYLWRVIRINEDGSVRLLYAGSGGTDGIIGTSAYNTLANHPGYVGFKYALGDTLEGTRGTIESTILTQLNTWYDTNLVKNDDGENSYDSYISREAVYCNDRKLATGSTFTTGSSTFYYTAKGRLHTNKTPTYNCKNEGDRFTGSNLTYPIGLMTADEVSFAGGLWQTNNPSVYYYLNKSGGSATGSTSWWTMSPFNWNDNGHADMVEVSGSSLSGRLSNYSLSTARGVRPVLSLKSCTSVSGGNGAANAPYEVSISNSCKASNN